MLHLHFHGKLAKTSGAKLKEGAYLISIVHRIVME